MHVGEPMNAQLAILNRTSCQESEWSKGGAHCGKRIRGELNGPP